MITPYSPHLLLFILLLPIHLYSLLEDGIVAVGGRPIVNDDATSATVTGRMGATGTGPGR